MDLSFDPRTWPLPEWLPWWVPAVLAVPVGLYLLLALLVPFGTFGVKSRLEDIELQLEELRGELRELAYRAAPPPEDAPRLVPESRARAAESRPARAEPRLGPR